MIKRIVKFLIAGLGLLLGYSLTLLLFNTKLISIDNNIIEVSIYVIIMLGFGIVMYLLSDRIVNLMMGLLDGTEKTLASIPPTEIAFGALGLLFGLIFAFFISAPLRSLNLPFLGPVVGLVITIILYIVLGTVGARLALRYKDDVIKLFPSKLDQKLPQKKKLGSNKQKDEKNIIREISKAKVLDTSVLIDGRIANIVESDFLDGPLVIAEFVLEELQFIADSADDLKRERGRRGLDIVKQLQNSKKVEVVITDADFEDTAEVDIKLLKLTKDLQGKVMTNDYNLNKVASVQGIPVLNVNDLANAVKTIVIPGEKMHVSIVKEGKEKKQGLAYLEDGTMIVVEDAKYLIGKDLDVIVTTVLQTAAGKMIFAKPVE